MVRGIIIASRGQKKDKDGDVEIRPLAEFRLNAEGMVVPVGKESEAYSHQYLQYGVTERDGKVYHFKDGADFLRALAFRHATEAGIVVRLIED